MDFHFRLPKASSSIIYFKKSRLNSYYYKLGSNCLKERKFENFKRIFLKIDFFNNTTLNADNSTEN